jgi:hypothetical protein
MKSNAYTSPTISLDTSMLRHTAVGDGAALHCTTEHADRTCLHGWLSTCPLPMTMGSGASQPQCSTAAAGCLHMALARDHGRG